MIPSHIENYINQYINDNYNDYKIVDIIFGHIGNKGIMKNPIFKISNTNNDIIYLLYCEKYSISELDIESYNIYKSYIEDYFKQYNKYITFYKAKVGYIYGTNKIMLHQIIMNLHGQGCFKDKLSIDHIDRNPLNNRFSNLRIVDFNTQQSNRIGILPGTKRTRKKQAQKLPEGVIQSDIPKYVYYCSELINKGKDNEYKREFFRIEKHPALKKKCISSTKSTKISIQNKLIEIKEKLYNLDNNIV